MMIWIKTAEIESIQRCFKTNRGNNNLKGWEVYFGGYCLRFPGFFGFFVFCTVQCLTLHVLQMTEHKTSSEVWHSSQQPGLKLWASKGLRLNQSIDHPPLVSLHTHVSYTKWRSSVGENVIFSILLCHCCGGTGKVLYTKKLLPFCMLKGHLH